MAEIAKRLVYKKDGYALHRRFVKFPLMAGDIIQFGPSLMPDEFLLRCDVYPGDELICGYHLAADDWKAPGDVLAVKRDGKMVWSLFPSWMDDGENIEMKMPIEGRL